MVASVVGTTRSILYRASGFDPHEPAVGLMLKKLRFLVTVNSKIDNVQRVANDDGKGTTGLYDRRNEPVLVDEASRILL